MEKLRKAWQRFLLKRLIRLGLKRFSTMIVFHEAPFGAEDVSADDPVTAIHFADSERSMNISMRSHVEELDK